MINSIGQNLSSIYSGIFAKQNYVSQKGFESTISTIGEKIANFVNTAYSKCGQNVNLSPFRATLLVATTLVATVTIVGVIASVIRKNEQAKDEILLKYTENNPVPEAVAKTILQSPSLTKQLVQLAGNDKELLERPIILEDEKTTTLMDMAISNDYSFETFESLLKAVKAIDGETLAQMMADENPIAKSKYGLVKALGHRFKEPRVDYLLECPVEYIREWVSFGFNPTYRKEREKSILVTLREWVSFGFNPTYRKEGEKSVLVTLVERNKTAPQEDDLERVKALLANGAAPDAGEALKVDNIDKDIAQALLIASS